MEQLLAIDSPEAYATIEEATCAQERTAASPVRQASVATTPVRRDDGYRLEENPDTVDSDQGLKRRQRSSKVCALYKMQPRKYTKYFCPECSTGDRRGRGEGEDVLPDLARRLGQREYHSAAPAPGAQDS
ncbi:hypothetical protein PF005_g33035 [Phytophthora fragariae]|uniref:PiggyBac transposable element-derived protein 4 C-terminal zinc-ribbon domain-containing protein n=1 Tax=Phytophthora fragariae TaxID=53985 RepID=A0A6A3V1E2_9STRA|nr:hypothetical protein PF005_g33035 [Phytophthora fragariae]